MVHIAMRKTEMGPKFFHGFDYHLRWGVLLNAKIAAEFSQPQTFLLQYFLVIAEGIRLCSIIIYVLAQYVIKWILEDGKISDFKRRFWRAWKLLVSIYAKSEKKSRNRFETFGKLWQKSINNSFRTPVDFLSRHFVIDVL